MKVNNKGFTLVEVVVVVAVIALVGILVMPSILNSLNTGKKSSDKVLYGDIKEAMQVMYEERAYTSGNIFYYDNNGKDETKKIEISGNSISTNIQTLISNGYLTGVNNEDLSVNTNKRIVVNSSGDDLGNCNVKITKTIDGSKVCYKIEGSSSGVCPTTEDFGGTSQCNGAQSTSVITYYNGSNSIGTQQVDNSTKTTLTSWSSLGGSVLGGYNGWSFAGWSESSSANTVKYTNGEDVTITNDTNLYAVYTRILTVNYNANGGSGNIDATTKKIYINSNSTNTSSQEIILKNNFFVYDGFVFDKWAVGSVNGTKYSVNEVYDPNLPYNASNFGVTIYAKWASNGYKVKYDGNGSTSGSMVDSDHVYGTAKNLELNTFTKTGYHFLGWATSVDGDVLYTDGQSVKNLTTTNGGVIVLYAKWDVNNYIIRYDANGGTGTMNDTIVTYNVGANASKNTFTRNGYSFGGWILQREDDGRWLYVNSDGSEKWYAKGTQPTGWNLRIYKDGFFSKSLTSANNVVIRAYAQWASKTYTLTFSGNGGTVTENSRKVGYNDVYGTLPTAERTGYTFNGWYTAKTGGTKVTSTTKMGATDTTIYAQWKANTYKVEYNMNGGTGTISAQTKTHGKDLTLSSTKPTRSGYEFSGWSTSTTGSVEYVAGGTYSANSAVTLYAVWSIKNYGVHDSCGGNSGTYSYYYSTLAGAISGATAGQCITLLKDMSESGTTFNKNLIFSTNGYTLTMNGSIIIADGVSVSKKGTGTITIISGTTSLFDLKGTANLTISDGRLHSEGGHAVNMYGDGKSATLTVNGGTLTNNASGNSVVPVYPAGKVTITSGTIYGAVGISLYGTATLGISGGHVYSTKGNSVQYNSGEGNISMTGGTIGSTSYNVAGLAFNSNGTFTMSDGTINVGAASAAYMTSAGTMTFIRGTVTSKAAGISNTSTGTIKLGVSDNAGTINVSTSGAGYSAIYCGNSDSGSNALCMLYKGARVSTSTGRAVRNYNGDFRVYVGAQINCTTTASYACLYNAGLTYTNTSCPNLPSGSVCEFGQIFIQQGYVQSVHAAIHSKVKNDYGVWIGSTYQALYTKSHFANAKYSVNINLGPMVRASDTTDGRGVYMDTDNSKWIFNNGIVGGKKTYTNQTPTVQRQGYGVSNFSYDGYKYGCLG